MPREPTSKVEREAYLATLRRAAARLQAEMAELAANGEASGKRVTREDLEREMKRHRACQDQGASELDPGMSSHRPGVGTDVANG